MLVFNQSQNVYHSVINNGNTGPLISSIENKITQILPKISAFDINQKISSLIYFLFNNLANVFNTTVSAIISFILVIFPVILLENGAWHKPIVLKGIRTH